MCTLFLPDSLNLVKTASPVASLPDALHFRRKGCHVQNELFTRLTLVLAEYADRRRAGGLSAHLQSTMSPPK